MSWLPAGSRTDAAGAFFLVILIEVALLLWGLTDRGRQHVRSPGDDGTTMAVIAAAIIFVNSLVFTMVVFRTTSRSRAGLRRS